MLKCRKRTPSMFLPAKSYSTEVLCDTKGTKKNFTSEELSEKEVCQNAENET